MQFFDNLYKGVNSSSASWETIAKETKTNTLNYTRNEQEPYYDLSAMRFDGSTVVAPTPPIPTPVLPEIQPNSTNSKLDYSIRELLSTSNQDARLSRVPSILQECFSNDDVFVVTIGRNLKTPVGYESAKVFLKRLALSDNIVKINIVKEHKDANGKCSYVTVHEVRNY